MTLIPIITGLIIHIWEEISQLLKNLDDTVGILSGLAILLGGAR